MPCIVLLTPLQRQDLGLNLFKFEENNIKQVLVVVFFQLKIPEGIPSLLLGGLLILIRLLDRKK